MRPLDGVARIDHQVSGADDLPVTTRLRRVETFVQALNLGPDHRILALGSEDGSYLDTCYPYPHRVMLADIDEGVLKAGVARVRAGRLLRHRPRTAPSRSTTASSTPRGSTR